MPRYVEVKGTPLAIGRGIGEHLRKEIAEGLNIFEKHLKASDITTKKRIQSLWKTAKKYFPDYAEEVRGVAEGSGAGLERIIRFNFEEEVAFIGHCSTFGLDTGRTIFLGHNEDWDEPMPLYVVKAKPKKCPEFLSLSYAGQIPTTSSGMNSAGIAFGNNSVATRVNYNGLPKNFCLRSMLSARSIDDIVQKISVKPRTVGNSCTVVSGGEIYLLEWSPGKVSVEKCFPWLAHANRFTLPDMQREQLPALRGSTSSARQQRMWQMLIEKEVRAAEDVKNILGDHANGKKSICRHTKTDKTIASVVIDVGRGEMQVTAGCPCNHPFRKYTL